MSSQVGDKIITKKAYEVDFDKVEEVDAEEVDKMLEKKMVNMLVVNDVFNQVVGEVLTLIDASIPDRQQNKALKDLLKIRIYDGLDTLHAFTDDQA